MSASTDGETDYWSHEDDNKPWDYGLGDGYVSEHGFAADGWYAVTRGFKVGIFRDA